MDGLLIKYIPRPLLARILVQLYIIPQQLIKSPRFDLLAILAAGLREYGDEGDLDGFLTFCAKQSFNCLEPTNDENSTSLTPSTWLWRDHTLRSINDWDEIDRTQMEEQENQNRCDATLDKVNTSLIGLRLQLTSQQVRSKIELVRHGKTVATLHDERFTHMYKGQFISVETILNGTLEYISKLDPSSSATTELLQQRLEQVARDRKEYEQQCIGRSETDFVLMGALMVKMDAIHSNGCEEDDWYLYLRDYTIDISGSSWRIIDGLNSGQAEMRVSSHQVLADLRGVMVKNDQGLTCIPSPTSYNYRPVYLFYCNNDVLTRSAQETESTSNETMAQHDNNNVATSSTTIEQQQQQQQNTNQPITFEDYSFQDGGDDNMDYVVQDQDDDDDELAMEMCKICGIPESIDDINTIFFCDECNLGVHQLCEQPPIAAFEMNIDPWYCRHCCANKGLPLPRPPHYITPRYETTTSTNPVLRLEPILSSSSAAAAATQHQSPSLPTTTTNSVLHLESTSSSSSSSVQHPPTTTITTINGSTSSHEIDSFDETNDSNIKKRKLDE